MNAIIKGSRPRPRVALVGKYDEETLNNLRLLFPTVWEAENLHGIVPQVDPRELDLVVIGRNITQEANWIWNVNVISFSSDVPVPNPIGGYLTTSQVASTEAYNLPHLPLNIDRLRQVDFAGVANIKGWYLVSLDTRSAMNMALYNTAWERFAEGAIATEAVSGTPLAEIFMRADKKLGVAILPNPAFRIFPWVELICTEWAKTLPDLFPSFGDWTKTTEWMTADELRYSEELHRLDDEEKRILAELSKGKASLQIQLAQASSSANIGIRRLIKSQSDELVDEVAKALEALGFTVTKMDDQISEGSPKLEDLRIKDPDVKDWQALVEVRGYSKSGGNTSDLIRSCLKNMF